MKISCLGVSKTDTEIVGMVLRIVFPAIAPLNRLGVSKYAFLRPRD
jgi:hypothetical protein